MAYRDGQKEALMMYGLTKDASFLDAVRKYTGIAATAGLLGGGAMGAMHPAPHGIPQQAYNIVAGAGGGSVNSMVAPVRHGFNGYESGGALGALKGVGHGIAHGIPDGANWMIGLNPYNR